MPADTAVFSPPVCTLVSCTRFVQPLMECTATDNCLLPRYRTPSMVKSTPQTTREAPAGPASDLACIADTGIQLQHFPTSFCAYLVRLPYRSNLFEFLHDRCELLAYMHQHNDTSFPLSPRPPPFFRLAFLKKRSSNRVSRFPSQLLVDTLASMG